MAKALGFTGYASGTVTGGPLSALAENTTGGVQKTYLQSVRAEAFTAQDATPSVGTRSNVYYTANSSGTTITALDDGVAGQHVCIVFADANTTVDFTSTTLKGNAGADKAMANGDAMICYYNGTNWYCSVIDGTT